MGWFALWLPVTVFISIRLRCHYQLVERLLTQGMWQVRLSPSLFISTFSFTFPSQLSVQAYLSCPSNLSAPWCAPNSAHSVSFFQVPIWEGSVNSRKKMSLFRSVKDTNYVYVAWVFKGEEWKSSEGYQWHRWRQCIRRNVFLSSRRLASSIKCISLSN